MIIISPSKINFNLTNVLSLEDCRQQDKRQRYERNSSLGKKEYQVKWVGYSNAENTWEPAKNLVSVKEILDEWNRKEDAKQGNKKTINKSLAKPQTVQKTQGAIQNNDAYESDSDKFV